MRNNSKFLLYILLSLLLVHCSYALKSTKKTPLPPYFDAVERWPECIHLTTQQGPCHCWAVTSTEILSDRVCIKSKGAVKVLLSPEYLLSCDSEDQQCNGGMPRFEHIFQFLTEQGAVEEKCMAYDPHASSPPTCPTEGKCPIDTAVWKTYKCKQGSFKGYKEVEEIKEELMTNGPLYCRMNLPRGYHDYKSGVFYQASGELMGGHAMKLVGWGIENGIEYWRLINWFGESFGENGFIRVKIGTSEICQPAYACQPDI